MKFEVPYTDFPSQFRQSGEETLEAVERVLAAGNFILGEEVEAFEKEFAEFCGTKAAVGVANGTDALMLALKALGVGPGDEVITAPNSFIATAGAVVQVGARPVFVDVRADQNIDPGRIDVAITPRTRAILPVHLNGRCADMAAILEVANRRGVPVIEDAAQAVGSSLDGQRAGSFGLAGCFSLHPLKNVNAVGDAGIITTNDEDLARRLRLFRNHGLRSRDESEVWGVNSRLDALQAAVLRVRLRRFPEVVEARRRNAACYRSALSSVVECPVERPQEHNTYHLFVIQCDGRDELKASLASQGVDTRVHYPIPIHLQRCCRGLGYRPGDFPAAERQAGRILSLPVHQFLTRAQVEKVCAEVGAFYAAERASARR
ncbi:MAG: DegT/DnrJ/EryC1/StrS family aminotransferase [Nitrospinota bacterium]